jgi:hypothetical protein
MNLIGILVALGASVAGASLLVASLVLCINQGNDHETIRAFAIFGAALCILGVIVYNKATR